MSKHAIYVLPICIGLAYLGYKKIESHGEQVAEKQFNEECLNELKSKVGDSISIVNKGDEVDNITTNSFGRNFFGKSNSYKVIDSSTFFIIGDTGDSLEFISHPIKRDTDTSWVTYTYNGYEELTKMHFIIKKHFHNSVCILVSQTTGKMYELLGYPNINEDGTLIFCKQDEDFFLYDNGVTGFQVWKNDNGTLTLWHNVRLKNYCIVNGGWGLQNKLFVDVAWASEYLITTNKTREQYELTLK